MYHLGLQKWGDRASAACSPQGASSNPALGAPPRGAVPCRAPQDGPVATVWEVLAGVWTPPAFPLLSWARALGSAPRLSWLWWELTWMCTLHSWPRCDTRASSRSAFSCHPQPCSPNPPPLQEGPGAQAQSSACWTDLDTWLIQTWEA